MLADDDFLGEDLEWAGFTFGQRSARGCSVFSASAQRRPRKSNMTSWSSPFELTGVERDVGAEGHREAGRVELNHLVRGVVRHWAGRVL
jgi:hypothetical protein